MTFTSVKTARERLFSYKPVYCLFKDENGQLKRWQLADVTILRKKKGFVRLLNVQGHEAEVPATNDLFDDGSR